MSKAHTRDGRPAADASTFPQSWAAAEIEQPTHIPDRLSPADVAAAVRESETLLEVADECRTSREVIRSAVTRLGLRDQLDGFGHYRSASGDVTDAHRSAVARLGLLPDDGDAVTKQTSGEAEYLDRLERVVAALYDAGETDAGGGVRPETIAPAFDYAVSTLQTHCNQHDGLEQVIGFDPTAGQRTSFVPVDGDDQDQGVPTRPAEMATRRNGGDRGDV